MTLKLTFEIEYCFDEIFNNDSLRVHYFVNHQYSFFGYAIYKNKLHGWYYKRIFGVDHNKIKKYIKLSERLKYENKNYS